MVTLSATKVFSLSNNFLVWFNCPTPAVSTANPLSGGGILSKKSVTPFFKGAKMFLSVFTGAKNAPVGDNTSPTNWSTFSGLDSKPVVSVNHLSKAGLPTSSLAFSKTSFNIIAVGLSAYFAIPLLTAEARVATSEGIPKVPVSNPVPVAFAFSIISSLGLNSPKGFSSALTNLDLSLISSSLKSSTEKISLVCSKASAIIYCIP